MKRFFCVLVFVVSLFTLGACSAEIAAFETAGVISLILEGVVRCIYYTVATIINTIIGIFLGFITLIDSLLALFLDFIS